MERIEEFKGDYGFLSNFWPCRVWLDNIEYPTVENAFQAAKTTDKNCRIQFQKIPPGIARKKGRQIPLRKDWEQIKIGIMLSLVEQKFRYSPSLRQQLKATGNAELIEGNTWGDTFWGVDLRTSKGENMLGKILMEVRNR